MRLISLPNLYRSRCNRGLANGMSRGRARQALSVVVCAMVLSSVALGQAPAKPSSHNTSVMTKDGVEIKITYFKSSAGQDAPVVILSGAVLGFFAPSLR